MSKSEVDRLLKKEFELVDDNIDIQTGELKKKWARPDDVEVKRLNPVPISELLKGNIGEAKKDALLRSLANKKENLYCSLIKGKERSGFSNGIIMCSVPDELPDYDWGWIEESYDISDDEWDDMVDSDAWKDLEMERCYLRNIMKASDWVNTAKSYTLP